MLCLVLILWGGVNDVGGGFDNRLAVAAFDNDLSVRDRVADLLRGMTKYRQTRYSQNVATVSNVPTIRPQRTDTDDVGSNYHRVNPNRLPPYAGPAGMDGLTGWTSETYYEIPAKIKTFTGRVEIFQGGMLPKRQWRYPEGSRFVEVLSHGGEVFEVRQRVKTSDGWKSSVPYRHATAYPDGYTGKLSKSCNECHTKAGASELYGVTVRGDDGVFSFPVLREGTTEFNESILTTIGATALPVDRSDASPGPRTAPPNDSPAVEPVGRSKRAAIYRLAREAAERTGLATYESDGLTGSALPAGRYELYIDREGDVSYREVEPPVQSKPRPRRWNEEAVPIPRPDSVIRDFRNTAECVGST